MQSVTDSDSPPVVSSFPRERTQLLPLLHAAHQREGYLSRKSLREIAQHVFVPESEAWGVATSYSEFRHTPPTAPHTVAVCTGLSCLLNGASSLVDDLRASPPPDTEVESVSCRFRCDAAPVGVIDAQALPRATAAGVRRAVSSGLDGAVPERAAPSRRPQEGCRVLARCGDVNPESIEDALARASYSGWSAARAMLPDEIVAIVEASGLLGRGGAYFPTAAKWSVSRPWSTRSSAAKASDPGTATVVNASTNQASEARGIASARPPTPT